MCFSASASFSAAAVLLPAGVLALRYTRTFNQPYWVLAIFPLVFALQQIIEGVLWLTFTNDNSQQTPNIFALSFLFIALSFWLFWVPYSAYVLEDKPHKIKLLKTLTIISTLFGLSLFLPIIMGKSILMISQIQHSFVYEVEFLHMQIMPRVSVRGMYAIFILLPLFYSSHKQIRIFAVIILLSLISSALIYGYAFISVWCFFAALMSIYLVYVCKQLSVKSWTPQEQST